MLSATAREATGVLLRLLAVTLTLSVPAVDASAEQGSFVTGCRYSHSLMDDPIVFPGQPGMSHLHDFFGSNRATASSTLTSIRRGSTTCRKSADTAAYWVPAAYLRGVRVVPIKIRAYYFGLAQGTVESYPVGIQMIAGNAAATSAGDNVHVSWSCGASRRSGVRTPIASYPYDCSTYADAYPFVDGIVARVDFPSCWDGRGLAPADVTYESEGCLGAAVLVPRLSLRVHLGITDPCLDAVPCQWNDILEENIQLVFSSGPYVTFHADFWNTWHQRSLDELVQDCLNARVLCGAGAPSRRERLTQVR
jgi:hypothetical protein